VTRPRIQWRKLRQTRRMIRRQQQRRLVQQSLQVRQIYRSVTGRLDTHSLNSRSNVRARRGSLGRRRSGTRLWSGRTRLGSLRRRRLLRLRRLRSLRGRCGRLRGFLRRRLGSRLLSRARGCRGFHSRGRSLRRCGRSRFRS